MQEEPVGVVLVHTRSIAGAMCAPGIKKHVDVPPTGSIKIIPGSTRDLEADEPLVYRPSATSSGHLDFSNAAAVNRSVDFITKLVRDSDRSIGAESIRMPSPDFASSVAIV